MRKDCVFFAPIRVRYGEVDQQGVVYNANYNVYVDYTFDEFFRAKGISYKELVKRYGSDVCMRKSTLEFFSSAVEGDMLEVGVRILHMGRSSFVLGFEMYRKGQDTIMFKAENVYVGFDIPNKKSKPITDQMRELLCGNDDMKI